MGKRGGSERVRRGVWGMGGDVVARLVSGVFVGMVEVRELEM